MRINCHAGHLPDGMVGCGAIGLIKESTEARKVKNEVVRMLKELGHTVYDCTTESGTGQNDALYRIVKKCNANNNIDLDVSIHFNAGANDKSGNGKSCGVEVYCYDEGTKEVATRICNAISDLGFKNRGVKYNQGFYVLRKTKAPAILIECCFVDDKDDVKLYDYKTMAEAIVKGIVRNTKTETTNKGYYRVQVGAFKLKSNAEALKKELETKGYKAIIVSEK